MQKKNNNPQFLCQKNVESIKFGTLFILVQIYWRILSKYPLIQFSLKQTKQYLLVWFLFHLHHDFFDSCKCVSYNLIDINITLFISILERSIPFK